MDGKGRENLMHTHTVCNLYKSRTQGLFMNEEGREKVSLLVGRESDTYCPYTESPYTHSGCNLYKPRVSSFMGW